MTPQEIIDGCPVLPGFMFFQTEKRPKEGRLALSSIASQIEMFGGFGGLSKDYQGLVLILSCDDLVSVDRS